jgi:hypothetical protein
VELGATAVRPAERELPLLLAAFGIGAAAVGTLGGPLALLGLGFAVPAWRCSTDPLTRAASGSAVVLSIGLAGYAILAAALGAPTPSMPALLSAFGR